MRKVVAITILIVAVSMLLAAPAFAGGKKRSRKGATRVDFDDALIKGQTHRGAVHLIERKDSNLGSLVKKRTNYRKKILAPYGYATEVGLEREPNEGASEAEKPEKVSRKKPNQPVASKSVVKQRRKKK